MPTLNFEDWGLIDYQEALNQQYSKLEQVSASGDQLGFLIFCSHPPIVTLGRKTQAEDVFSWMGPTIEISRGGRATYHGPSQLVVYPIIRITDIGKYLRTLEQGIVETLSEYGVTAVGKTSQRKDPAQEETEETGVWVGKQKIASLGIGVRKWITYHGAAINLTEDPMAFYGMKPCGFSAETMVSLERLAQQPIDRSEFSQKLKANLLEKLSGNL
jgi:lipoyl(octanoyl) transferase